MNYAQYRMLHVQDLAWNILDSVNRPFTCLCSVPPILYTSSSYRIWLPLSNVHCICDSDQSAKLTGLISAMKENGVTYYYDESTRYS
jgi:hypothetical protein